MSNYKITQALCQWISDAGGEVTEADQKSVLHAMQTLYTTLGGEVPENVPNLIAPWINGIEYVAGGGGTPTLETGMFRITNSTGGAVNVNQFKLKEVDGKTYATYAALAVTAGATKDMTVTKNGSFAGSQNYDSPYCGQWAAHMTVAKGVNPDKVIATISVGSVVLLRNTAGDTTKNYGFILYANVYGADITEPPLITISVSA